MMTNLMPVSWLRGKKVIGEQTRNNTYTQYHHLACAASQYCSEFVPKVISSVSVVLLLSHA